MASRHISFSPKMYEQRVETVTGGIFRSNWLVNSEIIITKYPNRIRLKLMGLE